MAINMENDAPAVSKQALQRLPVYLNYLRFYQQEGNDSISAPVIAKALNLNEVQVRKDLAAISRHRGRPKTGYEVESLIDDIEEFLGYKNVNDALLVGVGHLGRALLSYKGFEQYGLNIVIAFDADPALSGTEIVGKPVFPMSRLIDLPSRLQLQIGIIAVPAAAAQTVCDQLVRAGIRAVWNFAPIHLQVPPQIMVQNENMAVSLAMLSQHLAAAIRQDTEGRGR